MYTPRYKISVKYTLGGAELMGRGLSFIRPNGIAVKKLNTALLVSNHGRVCLFYDNLTAHMLYNTANNQDFSYL